jgi:actin-like protein 6A
VNAIVIDVGTYQVKAGYAGEDTPKFIFPSVRPWPLLRRAAPLPPARSACLLTPRRACSVAQAVGQTGDAAANGSDKMDLDGTGRTLHVGSHALAFRRDGMEVVSPFTDGILTDWEAVEALWDHTFK